MHSPDDIREALERHVPRGQWLPPQAIYMLIEANVPLDEDDWRRHYPSGYPEPRWHGLVRRDLKRLRAIGECDYRRP